MNDTSTPAASGLSELAKAGLTVLYLTIVIGGIFGNALVIFVILSKTYLRRTVSNYLLLNLSVADLAVLLFCSPTGVAEIYTRIWIFGHVMCKLVPLLENLVALASVLTISMISLERYWVICKPLTARDTITKKSTAVSIVAIWTFSGLFCIPFALFPKAFDQPIVNSTEVITVCFISVTTFSEHFYIALNSVISFYLPLLMLIFVYSIIIRKLYLSVQKSKSLSANAPTKANRHKLSATKSELSPLTSNRATQKAKSERERRQAANLSIGIVVLFFVCLFPFRVVSLLFVFSAQSVFALGESGMIILLHTVRICYYLNSAGNALVYQQSSSKFRRAFREVLCYPCERNKPPKHPETGVTHTAYMVYSQCTAAASPGAAIVNTTARRNTAPYKGNNTCVVDAPSTSQAMHTAKRLTLATALPNFDTNTDIEFVDSSTETSDNCAKRPRKEVRPKKILEYILDPRNEGTTV